MFGILKFAHTYSNNNNNKKVGNATTATTNTTEELSALYYFHFFTLLSYKQTNKKKISRAIITIVIINLTRTRGWGWEGGGGEVTHTVLITTQVTFHFSRHVLRSIENFLGRKTTHFLLVGARRLTNVEGLDSYLLVVFYRASELLPSSALIL